MTLFRPLFLCCLVITLTACSTVRPWQNQPARPYDKQSVLNQTSRTVNDDSVLMLVSMSGGGARATAFAYGVLEAMQQSAVPLQGRRTRLIDEIDVISGVSGGSIMATYFAAFGTPGLPQFEAEFLRKDFQDNLISYALKPGNLHDLSSPWFGRSHLLQRRLDDLFQHKTFGDLGNQPRLLVTATDLSLGTSFEFTHRQFALICSDLNSVPLSFAVAASSAVPIALSPLTLKNHNKDCPVAFELVDDGAADYRSRLLHDSKRSYLDADERPNIHLVDGGLADNLGLRAVLDQAQADGSLRNSVRQTSDTKIQKLIIIAVNAERDPAERIDASDQVPSTLQVVDALLFGTGARATLETLGRLKDTAALWQKELSRHAIDGKTPFAPDAQIHVVNINLRDADDIDERKFLLKVPTAFSIAGSEVDRLVNAGKRITLDSPAFKALVKSFGSQ